MSATDYPLACCCVAGTADVLGMDLAETVQRVMQTNQRAHIIKKKGTGGDWYGVLRGAASVGVPGDFAGAQLPHEPKGDRVAAER